MPGGGLGIVIDYGLGPGRLFEIYEKLCFLLRELLAIFSSISCAEANKNIAIQQSFTLHLR